MFIHRSAQQGKLFSLIGILVAVGVCGSHIHAVRAQPVPAPALGVVTNTADEGLGSLRQAIVDANTNPGLHIVFNIPKTDSNFKDGSFVIQPVTPLPDITADGTVIDGTTQTAFTGDTNPAGPEIVVQSGTNRAAGLAPLALAGAKCVIKSLVINSQPGKMYMAGLRISGAKASENQVLGCFIGTDPTGMMAQGNESGIVLDRGAHHNRIGGISAADRNVISGSSRREIELTGSGTNNNVILGNYIGVSADGKKSISPNGGIVITEGAKNNIVGGPSPDNAPGGSRNIICANGASGAAVSILKAGSDNNIVQGNYIGTDKDGTMVLGASLYGVLVTDQCRNNVIGGATRAARNAIANHKDSAISITYCSNTFVKGNDIGVGPDGTTPLGVGGNGITVYGSKENVIGGAEEGATNLICGNMYNGINLIGQPGRDETSSNIVQGNIIGIDATGKPLANAQRTGIGIYGNSYKNIIGLAVDGSGRGNIIAGHAGKSPTETTPWQGGIVIECGEEATAWGNTIRGNAIYNNSGLGINLKVKEEEHNVATPNDMGDADGGPNHGQNYPVITGVAKEGGKTVVKGSLNSTPNTEFIIDLFRNTAANASGYGEGEVPKGLVKVTTDANGHADFTLSPIDETGGAFFTATAINTATGETSEFSQAVK